jgi:hypothetical protein
LILISLEENQDGLRAAPAARPSAIGFADVRSDIHASAVRLSPE